MGVVSHYVCIVVFIIVLSTNSLQLARQGLNVVLMSRSQEKLERVANEISKSENGIHTHTRTHTHTHTHTRHTHTPRTRTHTEEKYGREVRVLPTDFSRGEEIYPEIAEKVKDLDIGILGKISMAGVIYV